jgi:hypothetical protein
MHKIWLPYSKYNTVIEWCYRNDALIGEIYISPSSSASSVTEIVNDQFALLCKNVEDATLIALTWAGN